MGKVYHYTSIKSFEAIIKSQNIRMTRSDFMNDPQDCHVFFDIVEKYINKKIIGDTEIFYKAEVQKEHIHHIRNLTKKHSVVGYMKYIYENIPMYIFSLSTEKDSLPMWNYYGGDGIRFAFEMDSVYEKISRCLCTSSFELTACTKVEYIEENTELSELTLNSFSDIKVRSFSQDSHEAETRTASILHKDGQNLEFFTDSYIKSYLKTIDYIINEVLTAGGSLEEALTGMNDDTFYKMIFHHNRRLNSKIKLKFKADLDLYMLILASRYKIKTFENEAETRIVYLDYNLEKNKKEEYAAVEYGFGTIIKPFVSCDFGENGLNREITGILLSPATRKLPLNLEKYKETIRDFCGIGEKIDIDISGHHVRW